LSAAARLRPHTPIQATILAIGIAVWVIGGTCAAYQYTVLGPPTDRHRDALAAELASVSPPPGVAPGDLTSNSKPTQGLVTTSFATDPGWVVLRQYDDPVLAQSGWVFTHVSDTGGYRVACYRRSDEYAHVTENPDRRTYSLSFSFGLRSCE